MSDGMVRAAIATGAVLIAYGLYAMTSPSADGAVFGTVMTALGAIGGYTVAKAT